MRVELAHKTQRCAHIAEHVECLETAISDLFAAAERSATTIADLRRDVLVARERCVRQEVKVVVQKAGLDSMREQLGNFESRFTETIRLMEEYQKRISKTDRALEDERRRSQCCSCMSVRATCALTTCGHCVICRTCTDRILELPPPQRRCPMCRAPFTRDDTIDLRFG